MNFDTICAILVNEPFNLRPWEIAQLTDYQINNIYFHPRTKEGAIDVDAYAKPAKEFSYEDEFRYSWQQKGLSQAEIDAKWAVIQANKPKDD